MTRRLVQVISLGVLSFALPTLALAAPPTSEPSGEANVEAGDEGAVGGAGNGKPKDRGASSRVGLATEAGPAGSAEKPKRSLRQRLTGG